MIVYATILHHYIKILVVHPSVTGGQRKRFDVEQQETVSLAIEQQRLQLGDLCEWQQEYIHRFAHPLSARGTRLHDAHAYNAVPAPFSLHACTWTLHVVCQ